MCLNKSSIYKIDDIYNNHEMKKVILIKRIN